MTIDDKDRAALVQIIATAAGTDFNNAQFLVASAIGVIEKLDNFSNDKDKIAMLAVYLNSIGASMTPAFAARHNIPKAAPVDPALLSAARQHVASAPKPDESFPGHIDPRLAAGEDFNDFDEVIGDGDDAA